MDTRTDFSRIDSRGKSPLLQDHPSVGLVKSLKPSDYDSLKTGTLAKLDENGTYWVKPDNGLGHSIPVIVTYPYLNPVDGSGIVMAPRTGCRVAYQQIMQNGTTQAIIVGYIPVLRMSADKKPFTDPQLEIFKNEAGNPEELDDNGFETGDLMMSAPEGNKVKVHIDGTVLVKSTPYNFVKMFADNRRYSWCLNNMDRTPGSYCGEFNNITTKIESLKSYHYHIEKHFVNPVEQTILYQEEAGLVDKTMTVASGEFDDVPNTDLSSSFAVNAKTAEPVAKSTLSGYSVHKRRVYDNGGRAESKTPRAQRQEYFCEEIKTDGAYRVRIGAKQLDAPKAALAVEVYYKPDGTWSIGSPLGKIRTTAKGDMILSTGTAAGAVKEVSIANIIDFMNNHVHGYMTPAGPLATGTTNPASEDTAAFPIAAAINAMIPGLNTGYIAATSNIPDPNLNWTT